MLRRYRLLPALLILAGAALPAAAQRKPAPGPAQALAAIKRANAEWAAATARGDAAAVAALFTEDAIVMGPGGPAGSGRAAIQAGVAAMPPVREPSLTTQELEVLGSTAIERGAYRMTFAVPGGTPFTDVGKYVVIWKRGSDGAWRMHRDIFNSDLPAPAAPVRAAAGDSVFLVINHVKPEARAEFERMANELFLGGWRKMGETDARYREVAKGVRLLAPTGPDADGSYTYVTLVDPHRPGVSYDGRAAVAAVAGADQVPELLRAWMATLARPQEVRWVVQK